MSLPPFSDRLRYLLRADAGTYADILAATPVTADNTQVKLWRDQSGNVLDAGTAGTGPTLQTNEINSLPCLRFASGNSLSFRNSFIGPARTVYAVVKATDAGVLTLLGGEQFSLQFRLDALKMRLVETATADIGFATNAMSSGTWTQVNMSWNGTAGVYRQAGAANGSVSASFSAVGSATRFLGKSPTVEEFLGDMALLMEFADIHDTTARQSVESWINGVWGV